MTRRGLFGVMLILALLSLAAGFRSAQAGNFFQSQDAVVNGAMLYDNWLAAKGVDAPAGDMPLWGTQSSNTRSGAETWRCVSCHGWDYQGRDGAYRYGSNFTGFPGVFQAREKGADAVIAALQGTNNPQHNFSEYLTDQEMSDLATFITTALINDNEYIDPQTLAIVDGDEAHGQELYNGTCAECHGEDGTTIGFDFEGRDATLGTLATLDPWRFLHKTRYGTPGTQMAIGHNYGWTPEDGRDVILYARSFPTNLEAPAQGPSIGEVQSTPGPQPGGPANNIITGILTAFGAMAASLGFAVLIGGLLVGVILLLVWLLRGQNK